LAGAARTTNCDIEDARVHRHLLLQIVSIARYSLLKSLRARALRSKMKACIRLVNGELVAELEGNCQLTHIEAVELADQLWQRGIGARDVSAVDWHTDPIGAPTSGQKVALFSRLKALENAEQGE